MSRRKLKEAILRILAEEDLTLVEQSLSTYQPADVVNPLFSALCSLSETTRWHAITCFGVVTSAIAETDIESARIIMRRFLWSLNDESGGIGWGAPEAMAEIMVRDERLRQEYLHMLISYMRQDGPELFQDGNYLELPLLQRGLLWGIGRLCREHQELMQSLNIIPELHDYLLSSDSVVRGRALWCLILLGDVSAKSQVNEMQGDESEVPLYLNNQQQFFTVGDLADRYLQNRWQPE